MIGLIAYFIFSNKFYLNSGCFSKWKLNKVLPLLVPELLWPLIKIQ